MCSFRKSILPAHRFAGIGPHPVIRPKGEKSGDGQNRRKNIKRARRVKIDVAAKPLGLEPKTSDPSRGRSYRARQRQQSARPSTEAGEWCPLSLGKTGVYRWAKTEAIHDFENRRSSDKNFPIKAQPELRLFIRWTTASNRKAVSCAEKQRARSFG